MPRTLPKRASARLVPLRARYKARKWAIQRMRTTRYKLSSTVRRSDVGEPHDLPLGFSRIRSYERDYYNEDDNEDDATQNAGQTTPSQGALILIYYLHGFPQVCLATIPYVDPNFVNQSMFTLNDLFISPLLSCRPQVL